MHVQVNKLVWHRPLSRSTVGAAGKQVDSPCASMNITALLDSLSLQIMTSLMYMIKTRIVIHTYEDISGHEFQKVHKHYINKIRNFKLE